MRRVFQPLLVVLAAVLALAACKSVYTDVKTAPEASAGELGQGEGIVFASLVEKNDRRVRYNGFRFTYRNLATGKIGWFTLNSGMLGDKTTSFSVPGGTGTGVVKSYTLPAGAYAFTNFSLVLGSVGGYSSWSAEEDFSIPFTVVAGRAAYLGEIRLIPLRAKNVFGIKIPAGGTFEIVDNAGQDVALFRQQFPRIDPSLIDIRPLRSGNAPAELIAFR